jgi:Spx/MgsR family transcriptional regulator
MLGLRGIGALLFYGVIMNIQIFGTKKCNDTKKAERYFKERGIKFQFIDMKEKGLSKGELTSVASANGGIANLVNPNAKDKDAVALFQYIADEDKLEKLLENQQIIKTPIVRNGKQSTLGYQPDVWKGWE